MQITLFRDSRRSSGKFHIELGEVECFYACQIPEFHKKRTRVFVDLEETKATGKLYIELLHEKISWNRDDEVCQFCSKALLRIIKQDREPSGGAII